MRAHRCRIQDAGLDLALDHGRHRRGAAGEGHMRCLGPRALQEKLHAQLFSGTNTARAIGSPARFALQPSHQFGHIGGGHVLMHDQHIGDRHRQADRGEILLGIIAGAGHDGRVDGHGAAGGHNQRMAIGGLGGDMAGRDGPRGAGAVFHHHILAERGLHGGGHQARHQIIRPTRGKGHHQHHGPAWRPGALRAGGASGQGQGQAQHQAATIHPEAPCLFGVILSIKRGHMTDRA